MVEGDRVGNGAGRILAILAPAPAHVGFENPYPMARPIYSVAVGLQFGRGKVCEGGLCVLGGVG
jgi:hypothetical protein